MKIDETITILEACTSNDPAACLLCPFRKEPHCVQKMMNVALEALKIAREHLPKEPVDVGEGFSYSTGSTITMVTDD